MWGDFADHVIVLVGNDCFAVEGIEQVLAIRYLTRKFDNAFRCGERRVFDRSVAIYFQTDGIDAFVRAAP